MRHAKTVDTTTHVGKRKKETVTRDRTTINSLDLLYSREYHQYSHPSRRSADYHLALSVVA